MTRSTATCSPGLCRDEELLRLLRFAMQLSRETGVPIESAMITDVPGYTWGVVPAFAHAGVKYFSGTATYTRTIEAEAGWFAPGAHQWLDLGDVQNLAEVSVNGTDLGVVWKKPFRVDMTGAARPGPNRIEVRVTNLWVNRIIGDRQPGAARQYTFTRPVFYKAGSPLLPSGLLGPVRVQQACPMGARNRCQ